ncbi:hypothetical protein ACFY4B_27035 [Kitasatospora sp. NPDC001261]|uniref:hypothetical protein n=1 Tax=Kitasatospora sp. NPDC001261 TaxID=3364012 RepID=UPI0036AFF94E
MSGTESNVLALEDETAQKHTYDQFLAILAPRPIVRVAERTSAGKRWTGDYPRPLPIAMATAVPGRPFVVHCTADFTSKGEKSVNDPDWLRIPFDMDAKTEGALAQVGQDNAVLQSYLGALGVPYVPAISGPSGGRHIWVAVPAGISGSLVRRLAAAAARVCPSLDVSPMLNRSGFGALRPPGSPHRNGGVSEFDGITLDEAVEALKVGATPQQIEQLVEWLEEEVALLPAPAKASAAHAGQALSGTGEDSAAHAGDLPPSVLQHGTDRVRTLEFDDDGHLKLTGGIRALDERARRALTTVLAPDDDHSHRLFPALRGLVRARWTAEEAWRVALTGQYPGLAYLTSERRPGGRRAHRDEKAGRKILDRQWMLACEVEARRPAGHAESDDPAPHVTVAVAGLWEFAAALGPARWSQRSGPADEAMVIFVGLQMLAAARLDVTLGTRRCANATGFCHETCNQAVNRLRDRDGMLTELDPDAKYHNRRVTISPAVLATIFGESGSEQEFSENTGLTQARNGRGGPRGSLTRAGLRARGARALALLASDLFAHGGAVGHHGGRTWLTVADAQGLLSMAQLIQETGYGERTVCRHMAAFSDAGLVTGDPVTGWTRTDKPLEEAAKECETAGTREARAARYEIDQMVWKWWGGEVWWMKLPNKEKRHHPRVPARQCVLKVGQHPSEGRRFPRRTCGAPDHSEAARLLLEDLGRA